MNTITQKLPYTWSVPCTDDEFLDTIKLLEGYGYKIYSTTKSSNRLEDWKGLCYDLTDVCRAALINKDRYKKNFSSIEEMKLAHLVNQCVQDAREKIMQKEPTMKQEANKESFKKPTDVVSVEFTLRELLQIYCIMGYAKYPNWNLLNKIKQYLTTKSYLTIFNWEYVGTEMDSLITHPITNYPSYQQNVEAIVFPEWTEQQDKKAKTTKRLVELNDIIEAHQKEIEELQAFLQQN